MSEEKASPQTHLVSVSQAARILYEAFSNADVLPPAVKKHAGEGHFFSALRLLFEPGADLRRPWRCQDADPHLRVSSEMVNAAWNAGKRRRMTGASADFRAVLEAALSAATDGEAHPGDGIGASLNLDLADRLRDTTQSMASFANVDMQIWDRHSNACLEAATEIESLANETERLRKIVLDLQNERLVMLDALKPFASCADEIDYTDKGHFVPL